MEYLGERLYSYCPIPIQNLLISAYGRRIRKERFGPEFDRLSDFLARSEWSSCEELEAYQEERLRAIVSHAYGTVPYYRELMDGIRLRPSDIRTLSDLPKLPVDRHDLKDTLSSPIADLVTGGTSRTAIELELAGFVLGNSVRSELLQVGGMTHFTAIRANAAHQSLVQDEREISAE